MSTAFAYDRSASTRRWLGVDGRRHVPRSVISRSEVSDYLSFEVPNAAAFGLRAGTIVPRFRDPDELRQRGMAHLRRPDVIFTWRPAFQGP